MTPDLPLAPTLAALGDQPKAALDRLSQARFRFVQLSATQPGLRPRDLDRSARRDLSASLRRFELRLAGLDLWIPPEHFNDPAFVDRAMSAVTATLELAADLGRCPVSLALPSESPDEEVVESLGQQSARFGVPIADHNTTPIEDESIGVGLDPAAWLSRESDPAKGVTQHASRLVSARLSDLLDTGLRGPIGQGQGRLDVLAYRVALTSSGYEQPVVADARQWADPWSGLAETAEAWTHADIARS